jgi:tripartite-type tricarboxylate transporter receptor subunit TctC
MNKLLMSVLMAAALPAGALAQAWPDKPINVVVPFGAGGGVDAAARIVMPKLAERLGQQVLIENVPGASGTIGTQRVTKAKADGYTLLFAVASPINVAPLVAPASVRYDALKDLAPIAPVAVSPFVLVGKPGLPATTTELLALARKQPGKLTYGTDGFGTSLHLTAAMITATAGVDILHVPYKSGPQVLTDVAGGQVDLAVLPVALVQGMVKEGKVKAYGVTSKNRSEALPGVPSLSETPALATHGRGVVDGPAWPHWARTRRSSRA